MFFTWTREVDILYRRDKAKVEMDLKYDSVKDVRYITWLFLPLPNFQLLRKQTNKNQIKQISEKNFLMRQSIIK